MAVPPEGVADDSPVREGWGVGRDGRTVGSHPIPRRNSLLGVDTASPATPRAGAPLLVRVLAGPAVSWLDYPDSGDGTFVNVKGLR